MGNSQESVAASNRNTACGRSAIRCKKRRPVLEQVVHQSCRNTQLQVVCSEQLPWAGNAADRHAAWLHPKPGRLCKRYPDECGGRGKTMPCGLSGASSIGKFL